MIEFATRTLLACVLATAAHLTFAQENPASTPVSIAISSGLEGGGYWNAAQRLQSIANGMGLVVQNQASTGSIANLKVLLDKNSPVSLAFAQADALQYYLNENPDAAQAVDTVNSIGEECVFILSDGEGDIETDEDMQGAPRLNLGIRSPNSGIRVTFDYMRSLVPELQNLSVSYGDTVDMMDNFAARLTDVQAVMIVHGPNERSPEIDKVLTDPDRFHFVEISDARFTQKLADGKAIYHSKKVAPGAVEGARKVETICVRGLLVANNTKLSSTQRGLLTELVDKHWAQVRATFD